MSRCCPSDGGFLKNIKNPQTLAVNKSDEQSENFSTLDIYKLFTRQSAKAQYLEMQQRLDELKKAHTENKLMENARKFHDKTTLNLQG